MINRPKLWGMALVAVATYAVSTTTSEATVITLGTLDPDLVDGAVDGWSGITVLETPLENNAPEIQGTVVSYNYNTAFAREFAVEAGDYEVTPLLVKFNGTDYSIIGVGATHTPTIDLDAIAPGFQSEVPFDLQEGTDTFITIDPNESYHIGFLQQNLFGDNTDGGVSRSPTAPASACSRWTPSAPTTSRQSMTSSPRATDPERAAANTPSATTSTL